MTQETRPDEGRPLDRDAQLEQMEAAIDHLHASVASQSIATGAAKGLAFSLIETLGTLIGDPDLPEHARSGYEALRAKADELMSSLDRH
ncbi:hypothetical protein [Burkholderia plantarii]|uniref:Major surface protein 3 n=1 Tax=Burkholderia plantarii TaxID=41899 RepID=A0A0B6S474_BURPL|nr:hypothetical protein [Burkholderia plantarii]AJK50468.1 hypothetical protein BGL_2c24120 [Burkholderia plantarii]ALK34648.1 major surface protein 3 [Burkholderia plantarii]WLE63669.1 hypothetical protein GIY62_25720 [Burkholderia plantarii]GLZ22360.1 hypothetical protein Bpla01_58890 [Burkholderia plantarii]